MTDYNTLKVPDLKKLLQERGLAIAGNKADLIARLQEHDKKAGSAGGEDEIDWDEDDTKATTAPAAAAVAAGGQGPVTNPTVVPNQIVDTDPSTTKDLKVISEGASKSTNVPVISAEETAKETAAPAPAPEAEAPKQDFSAGISQTDAEKEAERRAARAKRFGISEDDEAKKLAERAKKFGVETKQEVVKGLDSALPERRVKRGRVEERQGGRNSKRQTPDRRAAPPASKAPVSKAVPAKKALGRVVDDPTEKAKADARAKRFQSAV